MGYREQEPTGVPEDTATVARQAFPKGNVYMRLRDELGEVFSDAAFRGLFSLQGKVAVSAGRLALVLVMQTMEGLTDRQAADAVRSRIDWKYVLGLSLIDAGFDASVLSEFRGRLLGQDAERLLLDRILQVSEAQGLLKAGGSQRSDSTHVIAAVREMNRLECVDETLRAALEAVAEVAPAWLQGWMPQTWIKRYDQRLGSFGRVMTQASKRQDALRQVGEDGFRLLEQVYQTPAPMAVRIHPQVEMLRQIWVQQYERHADQVQPREDDQLPPVAKLLVSPYDGTARKGRHGNHTWLGYRVCYTETCDADRPRLITSVQTVTATCQDRALVDEIQTGLHTRGWAPRQQIVDTGFVSGDTLVRSQARQITLLGRVAADTSWQARQEHGLDLTQFQVDWPAKQVTCPRGCHSHTWSQARTGPAKDSITAQFHPRDCQPCPLRQRCIPAAAQHRVVHVQSQPKHEAIQRRRQEQLTPAFKQTYRIRAGIEGTIAHLTGALDFRETRYRGHAKVHLQSLLTSVALNVIRLMAWRINPTHPQPRPSHLAALAPSL